MPSIGYAGGVYPLIAPDKMTPGEIDSVERNTGLTMQKIRRMGETCVCEHQSADHTYKDAAGEIDTSDTSCSRCSCPKHEADVPMRINTAFAYISLRRCLPTLRFDEFADAPFADWNVEDEEGAPVPTEPPPAAV